MTNLLKAVLANDANAVKTIVQDPTFSPYADSSEYKEALSLAQLKSMKFSIGRDHRGNIQEASERHAKLVLIIRLLKSRKASISQFELEGVDGPSDSDGSSSDLSEAAL